MNAFGIDYQATVSVICLREGNGFNAPLRSVGDGLRHLIPNAVADEELWGSHALFPRRASTVSATDSIKDGPWLNDAWAPAFWKRLYRRLYFYLGHVEPVPQNYYTGVVAIQAQDHAEAAERVRLYAGDAGFVDVSVISALQALFYRWISQQAIDATGERTVVFVSVGDTSTMVTAHRLRITESEYPRMIAAGPSLYIERAGQAWWAARLTDLLHERLSGESIPPEHELVLRDEAIRFGAQLSLAQDNQQVEYKSVLQNRMYQPLKLSIRDCETWPEVVALKETLPGAITEIVRNLGSKADLIVIGGVGAVWPFARQAATAIAPVWQSSNPQEDVACGSAWFPTLIERGGNLLVGAVASVPAKKLVEQTPESLPDAAAAVTSPAGNRADRVAPWKRKAKAEESDYE